jgi:hypothetical protein
MSEKHAFHQRFRQNGAIHNDKIFAGSFRILMDSPGKQFFSRAGFKCSDWRLMRVCMRRIWLLWQDMLKNQFRSSPQSRWKKSRPPVETSWAGGGDALGDNVELF